MRTVIFTFRAIVPEDFPREQIAAMSLAAAVQIQEPEDGPNPERVTTEEWAILDGPSEGIEIEDLGGFYDEFQASLLAPLFGAMVRRARLVTEHYHGDLFHDATWLREHVKGETSFYWAPRTFGANIGTDPKFVGYGYDGRDDEMHFYRVDIGQRLRSGKPSGMWQATFTRCEPGECEDLTPTEDVS
jgi:hypothetical protein